MIPDQRSSGVAIFIKKFLAGTANNEYDASAAGEAAPKSSRRNADKDGA